MTAKSLDSYKGTLRKVLVMLNPQYVLEWGPGISTVIMARHPSVKAVYTVEHKKAWIEKFINERLINLKSSCKLIIAYQPDLEIYPHLNGHKDKYDLIFVDGRQRVECLKETKKRLQDKGVAILHDAERPRYKEGIDLFKYKIFTDKGNTVVLTDSEGNFTQCKDMSL